MYVFSRRKKNKYYGEITKLLKREKKEYVGKIEISEKFSFVIVDNKSFKFFGTAQDLILVYLRILINKEDPVRFKEKILSLVSAIPRDIKIRKIVTYINHSVVLITTTGIFIS